MKHIYLCLLLILAVTVNAQEQISNGDFESWTNQGNYDDPDGWGTLNFLTSFGAPVTVFKSDSANHGNHACELISSTFFNSNLIAFAFTGNINNNIYGQSFNSKPTRVQFDYTTLIKGQDTAYFILTLSRWDADSNKRDSIAYAEIFFGETVPKYTMADIPINYTLPNLTPDTIGIYMAASYDSVYVEEGNTLTVDNIRLSYYPVGINPTNEVTLHFYPNPASTSITFASTEDLEITVFSTDDRNIANTTGRTLDITTLPKGIYYMRLQGKQSNTYYKTQKLIKQ